GGDRGGDVTGDAVEGRDLLHRCCELAQLVLVELRLAREEQDRGDALGVGELGLEVLDLRRLGGGGQVGGRVVGGNLLDLPEERAAEPGGRQPHEDQHGGQQDAQPGARPARRGRGGHRGSLVGGEVLNQVSN